MTEFCTLASSSGGNCSFLRTDNESFLIDAGISCRAIVNGLKALDSRPENINGIFITHEHSDHIKGLKVLLKKYAIPVYSSPEVLEYLIHNDLVPTILANSIAQEKANKKLETPPETLDDLKATPVDDLITLTSYDSRKYNIVTTPKHQGSEGLC